MNRTLWTLTTLLGITGGYYLLLGRLHGNQIEALHREIDGAYAMVDRAEHEAAQVTNLRGVLQDLERWQQDLQGRLTRDPAATPMVVSTRNLLETAGLVVDRAETMGDDGSLGLPHQRIRVLATGAFGGLFQAIRDLENQPAPTRVTDLVVTTAQDPRQVRAELTVVRTWSLER